MLVGRAPDPAYPVQPAFSDKQAQYFEEPGRQQQFVHCSLGVAQRLRGALAPYPPSFRATRAPIPHGVSESSLDGHVVARPIDNARFAAGACSRHDLVHRSVAFSCSRLDAHRRRVRLRAACPPRHDRHDDLAGHGVAFGRGADPPDGPGPRTRAHGGHVHPAMTDSRGAAPPRGATICRRCNARRRNSRVCAVARARSRPCAPAANYHGRLFRWAYARRSRQATRCRPTNQGTRTNCRCRSSECAGQPR